MVFSRISGDEFLTWGWRVPFWLSLIMVAIGLYIRLGILETPVFARVIAENRVERAPTIEVFRRQPKQVALTALARMAEQAPGFIFGVFIFTYGVTVLGTSRDVILTALLVASILGFCWVPIAGHLSDRIGRKRFYLIGAAGMGAWGFVYYALLDTKVPGLIFLAVSLSIVPIMTMYGPQAALIAESFAPRLRYSGASLGYQLASIIAGGPAPMIATALFAAYHSSLAISLYILLCSFITIIAVSLLTDYTGKDISQAHEGV